MYDFSSSLTYALYFNIGAVEENAPGLAFATTGGKIILHSPHESSQGSDGGHLRFLNFNKKITAITAGITSSFCSTIYITLYFAFL